MHVQVITYRIDDVSEADFNAANQEFAEAMREFPGLISKVWLKSSDEPGVYGGVYFWRDKESCDAFLASELLGAAKADDSIRDLTSHDYSVNEVMTKITQPVLQVI
ncbi:MAG TPA: YdhR family protein [Actinomycetes bacterium]|nr:YdhR family protein [Actinomycetes bacterium]